MATDLPGEGHSICVVRHQYYPAEMSVRREVETLAREGYDTSIICLRDKGEPAHEVVSGVKVYRMPVSHQRGNIWRYLFEYNAFLFLASLKLLWLHLRHRFDAVQINSMPDYLVFVALIPRLMGAKVLLHLHEPMPELFKTLFPQPYLSPFIAAIRLSEKLSVKFAHRVLTVTRSMRENVGKRGADVNKITVIVNVPDDEWFRYDRYLSMAKEVAALKKDERQKGIFRVLTHGAIEYRYGIDLIIRAVAALRERLPGLEFRLLGKGDYLGGAMDLARELNVEDRIKYRGFLDFDEMIRELLAADVGIVSMKKNPYSVLVHTNKMYEFIALRRPVIASRLDSTASYFPDDSLVYFEPGDHDDLAEKIYYVYGHPEEVDQLVTNAYEIYDTYRWDREKKKYLGVYQSLLKRSGTITV